jgi:hypothetical protein
MLFFLCVCVCVVCVFVVCVFGGIMQSHGVLIKPIICCCFMPQLTYLAAKCTDVQLMYSTDHTN